MSRKTSDLIDAILRRIEAQDRKKAASDAEAALLFFAVIALLGLTISNLPGMAIVAAAYDLLNLSLRKHELWMYSTFISLAIYTAIWIYAKKWLPAIAIHMAFSAAIGLVLLLSDAALGQKFPGKIFSYYFGSGLIPVPTVSLSGELSGHLKVVECHVEYDKSLACKIRIVGSTPIASQSFGSIVYYKMGGNDFDGSVSKEFPPDSYTAGLLTFDHPNEWKPGEIFDARVSTLVSFYEVDGIEFTSLDFPRTAIRISNKLSKVKVVQDRAICDEPIEPEYGAKYVNNLGARKFIGHYQAEDGCLVVQAVSARDGSVIIVAQVVTHTASGCKYNQVQRLDINEEGDATVTLPNPIFPGQVGDPGNCRWALTVDENFDAELSEDNCQFFRSSVTDGQTHETNYCSGSGEYSRIRSPRDSSFPESQAIQSPTENSPEIDVLGTSGAPADKAIDGADPVAGSSLDMGDLQSQIKAAESPAP